MHNTYMIACSQWLGPSRNATVKIPETIMTVSFVTQMTLKDALNRLSEYQRAYNLKHSASLYLALTPFCVSSFPLDSLAALTELSNVTVVEELEIPQGTEVTG